MKQKTDDDEKKPGTAVSRDRPQGDAKAETPANDGKGKREAGREKPGQAGEKPPGGKKSASAAGKKRKKTANGGGQKGLLIGVAALLLAAAAALGLYQLLQRSEQQDLALSRSIDELRTELAAEIDDNRRQLAELDTLKAELATVRADVNAAAALRQRLESEQEALNTALAEMQARLGRTTLAWRLAEVEYLLGVANSRLGLERDVHTTLVALRTADRKLRAIGDPGLVPVRQAIAREIAALEALPLPDYTGLALRLGSLAERVEDLPLLDTRPPEAGGPTVNSEQEDYQGLDWADIPARVWEDIRGLVVIRHHDRPVEPLLPPAREWYLRQNLQLKLEQARLSLLRRQTDLFRRQLGEATDWITAWFDPEDSAVRSLLDSLAELQKTELQPALPDISESLRVLRGYVQRLDAGVNGGEGQ